ncbi:MAG: hypothetical protein KUL82_00065 [Bdellovibrio sp.]|nr:hypothetical protein [Bdellovibrio sp.]
MAKKKSTSQKNKRQSIKKSSRPETTKKTPKTQEQTELEAYLTYLNNGEGQFSYGC